MKLVNGQGIPPAQVGKFVCPGCKDEIFEAVAAFRMAFDRLDPDQNLRPVPVQLVRCLGCGGYLVRDKQTRAWTTVHFEGRDPSDDWKLET